MNPEGGGEMGGIMIEMRKLIVFERKRIKTGRKKSQFQFIREPRGKSFHCRFVSTAMAFVSSFL